MGTIARPGVGSQAANVDDRAARAAAQPDEGRLGAMECAIDAHIERRAPLRMGHFGKRRFMTQRGVVDQDIELAEARRDCGDHRVDLGAHRDIGLDQ